MAILEVKKTWRKTNPRPPRRIDLTLDEQANARRVVRLLLVKLGSWEAVAKAMETSHGTVHSIGSSRRSISAGFALRVARAAGVPMEDVISGAWPKPGACMMCGRGDG